MCDNGPVKRLLRLLLVLLLALPAAQTGAHPEKAAPQPVMAGHDMHAMHMMHGHAMLSHDMPGHEAPRHAPARHHDCIGCIAPIDIDFYRPASAPLSLRLREGLPPDTDSRLRHRGTPEPPPPRATV